MATQVCPHCNKDAFTWSMKKDQSGKEITTWGCHECNYVSVEDESFNKECRKCKNENMIHLQDNNKIYWWCNRCNTIEVIN